MGLRLFWASTRRALAARLGLVGRRLIGRSCALASRSTSRARASARLASCVRKRRAVIKRSPAPVIRLPASVFNRRYTSGSRPRRNTSTRNWHAVATLLTFCPPGPVEARNRSSIASSGIAISAIETRLAETLGERRGGVDRTEEHTSELQSLMRISYAVFCLNKN